MITNYLTFTVEKTNYALDVSAVLEVLNFTEPTAVPCALPYIEGLIFSREQGITVVNFRKRFDLPEAEIDGKTKVIVAEITSVDENNNEKTGLYGLVADSVQDVIQVYDDNEKMEAEYKIPSEFITEILKIDDAPLFVINHKKLFEEAHSMEIQKILIS